MNDDILKENNRKGNSCTLCGDCCKTVGVEIETPTEWEDFEYIRWYIFHKGLSVYVDRDGTWNIEISTDCRFLGPDNLCTIYDQRPNVCSEFDADQCKYEDDEDVESVVIDEHGNEALVDISDDEVAESDEGDDEAGDEDDDEDEDEDVDVAPMTEFTTIEAIEDYMEELVDAGKLVVPKGKKLHLNISKPKEDLSKSNKCSSKCCSK